MEVLQGQRDVAARADVRFDDARTSALRKEFLDSLLFPGMFERHESINPPVTDSFEWIFESGRFGGHDDETDRHLRGSFAKWLRSNQSFYWINGKAGSGKSSLMSFIEGDRRTRDYLQDWSGNSPLHVFSFFFWRPRSQLQKSIP